MRVVRGWRDRQVSWVYQVVSVLVNLSKLLIISDIWLALHACYLPEVLDLRGIAGYMEAGQESIALVVA